jgi:hypothetical protein
MAENRKLKKLVRERMKRTGERYTTARMNILASYTGEGPEEDTMTDDTTIVPGCFVRHPTRLRVEGCVREVRGDLAVVAYPNDVQLLPVGELERTARRPAYVSGARHSTPDQRS